MAQAKWSVVQLFESGNLAGYQVRHDDSSLGHLNFAGAVHRDGSFQKAKRLADSLCLVLNAISGDITAGPAVAERFLGFVHAARSIVFTGDYKLDLGFEIGKRYVRVITDYAEDNRSVYCFVNRVTGEILKAASWKEPARGVRGNINAADFGKSGLTQFGTVYFR